MKILLPIEDTALCRDVLERELAQPCPAGSEFKLITVLESLEQILPGPDPQYIPHARIVRQDMVVAANLFLREYAARLEARFVPGTVRFEVLEGFLADRIVAVASEWSADLIVIASRGRKGLSKMLLGSVAETVVLRAPCSVEVVHPEPAGTLAAGKGCQPQTVLIAIDTSECA